MAAHGVRVGLALRRRSVGCLGRVGGVVLGEARGRGVVLDAVVDGVDVVRRALVAGQRALRGRLLGEFRRDHDRQPGPRPAAGVDVGAGDVLGDARAVPAAG